MDVMALVSVLRRRRAVIACTALLVAACGSAKEGVRDGAAGEASLLDAGARDASPVDAGDYDASALDAAVRDGASLDAAVPDSNARSDASAPSDAAMADDASTLDAGGCGPGPLPDAIVDEPADECGACGTCDGPIGGGDGYPRTVLRSGATVVVANASDLIAALGRAACGDVIYVDDDASIDLAGLGGMSGIEIPAGVTLASGRGVAGSLGALIRTTERTVAPLFVARDGVRVTGLRIEGAQQDQGPSRATETGAFATRPASTSSV